VAEVLSKAVVYDFPAVYPFFKIIPLLLIWRLLIKGKDAGRWFSGYAACSFVIYALVQNAAQTKSYGFAVISGNMVLFLLVGGVWFWEMIVHRTQYQLVRRPRWRYWVVPLAFLSFWMPSSQQGGVIVPDFSPVGFFANEAGLTFCMMLPVYMAVTSLSYPDVNLPLLRISGWVGIVIGLFNILEFFTYPGYGWWMAILHLPLLSISLFSFFLGMKKPSPVLYLHKL
jgi:hypothetical protein